MDEASPPPPPPPPPRRTWRRRLLRLGRIALILYIAACAILYFAQDYLLFPGRRTQGTADAAKMFTDGVVRVSLTDNNHVPIVARYRAVADEANAPTILFCYGNAMCAAWCDSIVGQLNDLGCNVLVADYEGYGESGGTPSESGCYAAAQGAWDYLQTQRSVPASRIVVMGWSLGSAVAINLASVEHSAGLITLSAFTSLPDEASDTYPMFPVRWLARSKFDNLSKAPSVKCPVLMFHGQQDTLVIPDNATRLASAFGSQAKLVWLDTANHNTMFEADPEKLHAAIATFLAKVTPATQPSSRPPVLSSSQSSSSSSR